MSQQQRSGERLPAAVPHRAAQRCTERCDSDGFSVQALGSPPTTPLRHLRRPAAAERGREGAATAIRSPARLPLSRTARKERGIPGAARHPPPAPPSPPSPRRARSGSAARPRRAAGPAPRPLPAQLPRAALPPLAALRAAEPRPTTPPPRAPTRRERLGPASARAGPIPSPRRPSPPRGLPGSARPRPRSTLTARGDFPAPLSLPGDSPEQGLRGAARAQAATANGARSSFSSWTAVRPRQHAGFPGTVSRDRCFTHSEPPALNEQSAPPIGNGRRNQL